MLDTVPKFSKFLLVVASLIFVAVSPVLAKSPKINPSEVFNKIEGKIGGQSVNFSAGVADRREKAPDKTLAPYFQVKGADPKTESLPLKETSADVNIAGVIAQVKLKQVFQNTGAKPIEAIYVFPASTRAAVHAMTMKIGQRTIRAKIEERQKARQEYEQAKQEGKRASLLEQERPNVFTMNVANIMPRDLIEVELVYSELLVPENAIYEFVLPTVVGPRYGGGADPQKDKWIANPYQHQGEKESYKWAASAHLETSIPLKELSSPSHKIKAKYLSSTSADVSLDQKGGGNKDFILRYRLAGDKIETGALTWASADENFFLVMMEPPQRPTATQIPPREYIFLLDISGSMHGFPLDTAKKLMKNLLSQLRPSDYFNVAFFAGGSFVLSPEGSLPCNSLNIDTALEVIERQSGAGGTELMEGLKTAYNIARPSQHLSRSVVVVTDGYVGVEAQAMKFISQHLNEANLFAMGIGSSVNRALIEAMARAGLGEPFVVLNETAAAEQASKLAAYIQYPVLANIKVAFNGFKAQEVLPRQIPDLLARRPIILFGKYEGAASGNIEVSGYSGGGLVKQNIAFNPGLARPQNMPLRYLWARKWVELLDDQYNLAQQAGEIKDLITKLGLSYSLLTQFTSFVAVDSQVVNKDGKSQSVKQPLPLPEGVSDYAVEGGASREIAAKSSPAPAASYGALAAPSGKGGMRAKKMSRGGLYGLASSESSPSAIVLVNKIKNLSEASTLVKEIKSRLSDTLKKCGDKTGTVKLVVSVDGQGKVVKIDVLNASSKKLASCIESALRVIKTSAMAKGASVGQLEITVRALAEY